jgi:hypothetical protein
VFNCLFLFIPAKDLDDTKTIFDNQATNVVMVVMVDIVHKWEAWHKLPMTEIRNNNFGKCYYDSNI